MRRPKLGGLDWADKAEGKKQRHTAKRVFERLRDEHNAFACQGYSLFSLPPHVERLTDRRQRIYVATVGLARPEVFVLELEFKVRAEPGLISQSLSGRHSLACGSERCARFQRFVDGFLLAEPCLRLTLRLKNTCLQTY